MSDFFENEKTTSSEAPEEAASVNESEEKAYVDEFEGFDTIFSDPAEHKKKAPSKGGKKRILAVIASLLVVAILAGGTVAVIKLIPEKEDETSSDSTPFETIDVLNIKTDDISKVTVTNSKGTFVLFSEKVTKTDTTTSSSSASSTEPQTETVWYAEGVDKALVSSSAISSIVSNAASVSASRKIDTMTASECGFDKPVYKVDIVHSKGSETLLVGGDSLDGTGTYVKLASSEVIYLADSSDFSGLEFTLLDLADTSAIPAMNISGDASAYIDSNGALIAFDSVSVSGKNYPAAIRITPDKSGSELSDYIGHYCETPLNRPANNVDKLLALFATGVTVNGVYSYDVSASSLAAVGLDNPDFIVTMTVAGKSRTIKANKVDDEYYAVIADDSVTVKKVAKGNIEVASYTTEMFYSDWVLMRSINDLSNLSISNAGTDYSFDIKYNSEGEDNSERYIITHNGKTLTTEYFQDFYQIFVSLKCSDFTTEALSAAPDTVITLTYSADGKSDKIEFFKVTANKYQYSINGIPMGRITASSYNKLIRNVKLVSQDKPVE